MSLPFWVLGAILHVSRPARFNHEPPLVGFRVHESVVESLFIISAWDGGFGLCLRLSRPNAQLVNLVENVMDYFEVYNNCIVVELLADVLCQLQYSRLKLMTMQQSAVSVHLRA